MPSGDRSTSPDILIVEGLNVLQTGRAAHDGKAVPFVSDFFDFSIYIDADEPLMREWYVRRFLRARDTAFHDPRSYFHRYAPLSDEEATALRWRSGSGPTSPISTTTFCRPGRARR